jgi:LuxR family maltose regulon positive regulatory protein
MLSSLVATKLYIPPLRADHVTRPRLVEALDNGYLSGRRLSLISAPAGYGKTSLLSEWQVQLAERQTPMAWLSLEINDNDPQRFMHYILAAVRKVFPKLGGDLLSMLELPQPPEILEIAAGLINEIAGLDAPLVLVLDDYHVIHNPAIHELAGFLVDRSPANLHMVIASRHDPLLPLPRLRARGQMTEIRLKEMRFRNEEAADFLRRGMGLDIPKTSLEALQDRTEGWAAGLQLAAISLADGETSSEDFIQSFSGDDRHVLDYLLEEVLARQSAEVQRFLLSTSILEKFCAPLCNAVIQADEGQVEEDAVYGGLDSTPDDQFAASNTYQRTLDYLDRANLFLIPLDNRREWFRYHHLFAEALQHRMHRQYPALDRELHKRAAGWFDRQGLPAFAFDHAMAAGDIDLAADIAERWLDPVIFDGQIYQARKWLGALPESLVTCRPELLFRKARVFMMMGDRTQSLSALDEMVNCLEKTPDPFPRRPHLWTLNFTERARMAEANGDLDTAQHYIEQAMAWLPPDDLGLQALIADSRGVIRRSQGKLKLAEGDQMEMFRISLQYKSFLGTFTGLTGVMRIQKDQGQAQHALDIADDFLKQYWEEVKDLPALSLIYECLGEVATVLGRLEEAESWLEQALDRMKQGGIADEHGLDRTRLAQVKWALGKEAEVETLLKEAEPWLRRSNNERYNSLSGAIRARIRLGQGNLAEAAQWADHYLPQVEKPYRHEVQDHTLALTWLAQGKALEALHFLESRQPALEENEILLYLVENLAIQALALQRLGNQSQAGEVILRALHMAEPHGLNQIFASLGFEMALLLTRTKAGLNLTDRLRGYVDQVLMAFNEKDRASLPSASQPAALVSSVADDDWIEELSEREVEVLRWMARGMSNAQIAGQMVVAESTVKKHINHIFGKLAVENRTQALIKARERGLL